MRRNDPGQSKAFIEKAREIGATADNSDGVMRTLGLMPHKPHSKHSEALKSQAKKRKAKRV